MQGSDQQTLRQRIGSLPVLGPAAKRLYRVVVPPRPELRFNSSPQYWEDRYALGGNSGAGSYGRLAVFKAEVINRLVAEHGIRTVIEFGCGDGAQLALARYPRYTGIDVSRRAVERCSKRFASDQTKTFLHAATPEARSARADLALSLDVIYHLVEDEVYHSYMAGLATAASRFVCIYSSNMDKAAPESHIRHRRFTDWFAHHASTWTLLEHIPNAYPEDPARPNDTSWADFYVFASEAS